MIHVILPAYNEAENIALLLEDIRLTVAEVLPHRTFHVIVVDDGSADDTVARVERWRSDHPEGAAVQTSVTLLRHARNQGLAEAIKSGLSHCAGHAGPRDIVLTMDSDNSHTPGLIPSLVRLIHEGNDVVIASRYQRGARVVGLTRFRRLLSWGASVMMRVLFPIPNVRDYTCGFRAYRASLIKKVMSENPQFISERGFSVNVDILLKLRAMRPQVMMSETPLLLRYDFKLGRSKMKVMQTILDTLRLACRRRFGVT